MQILFTHIRILRREENPHCNSKETKEWQTFKETGGTRGPDVKAKTELTRNIET